MAATQRGRAPAQKPVTLVNKQNPKRGSSTAEQRVHTPKVGGSTPPPASTSSADDCGFPQDLNRRHRAFVVEYMKDKNAGAAYRRAGYSAVGNSAEVNGARLLRNAQIQAELLRLEQQALSKVQADTGISLERTLREIARIAYFDPRRMFGSNGQPLAITELDDDTAAVIAGLDVLEEWEGSGQDRTLVGHVKKWKLADKKGALDMLMKHLGGYKEDNGQAGSALGKALAAGMTVRFVEATT